LQIWSDLLNILHQVLGLDVVLIDAALDLADDLPKRFGPLSQFDCVFIAFGGVGRGVCLRDLASAVVAFGLQRLYALTRVAQRVLLAIKRLVAMTANAAAVLKQILSAIQIVRALKHSILAVTLIAPGLYVLLVVKRPKPMFVAAVPLLNRRSPSPV